MDLMTEYNVNRIAYTKHTELSSILSLYITFDSLWRIMQVLLLFNTIIARRRDANSVFLRAHNCYKLDSTC